MQSAHLIESKQKAVVLIQKKWRGYIARKKYYKLVKRYRKKGFIAKELAQSERTYCQNLEFVITKVLEPSREMIENKEMHTRLFSNLEQIYQLHNHFLIQLQQEMSHFNHHLTKLSGVIQKGLFKDQFKDLYTKYCFNYKTTDQTIKNVIRDNLTFNEHLKKLGLVSLNLSLESYMIKPVQRLCKYGLIIDQYIRNMEKDHVDYSDMKITSAVINKLVHETNDQVEQFLMRERFLELTSIFPSFFGKISSQQRPRMYYETKEMSVLDIIREQEYPFKSMALFQNSCIMVPGKAGEEPDYTHFIFGREIANSKYYTNMVQLVEQGNYIYIQFKENKDKKQFIRILNDKMKQQEQKEYQNYKKVSILGTETRESFFSSYTVYIVNIEDKNTTSTIYPRFKDLLKVQDYILSRGIIKFDPLLLAKESIISTLKSKTIEKRKLAIQEFLERVFNFCKEDNKKEIDQILGVSQMSNSAEMFRLSTELEEIWVYLPNMQKVKVGIKKDAKITDLKKLISQKMGMESTQQFEIFEIRNKNFSGKKLLYDGEPVKKIIDEQKDAETSINPFRDELQYLYTRHYYLSKEEEEELYKSDIARAELELSVIHSDILNYRLKEEIMITFMCLFAIYIHLPVDNSEKLNFFIKEITKKSYRVTEEEFRVYYSEVRKMIAGEESIGQSLPLIIIKIVSNSDLYQCLQFEVEVHHKIFSSYKKIIPSIEENVFLGLRPDNVYLLSAKDRSEIVKFKYSQLTITETRPKSNVFELLNCQTPLILKSQMTFQISKVFQIYKNKH